MKYLALLRGINVGGNNLIKMPALKACFEAMGFTDVLTYIQSGNVVFESTEANTAKLTEKVEAALSRAFDYKARVAVISHAQLKSVVANAPKGFGTDLAAYRYDFIFLMGITAHEAMQQLAVRKDIDEAWQGNQVIYFRRPSLTSPNATKSYLGKVIQLPVYQNMTIRNSNTTTKLLAMMNDL